MGSRQSKSSGSSSRARSLLVGLLFVAACATPAAPPRSDAAPEARPALDAASLARRTHAEVNRARAQENRSLLEWDDALVPLAKTHSEDMARRAFFAHQNPDGDDANARAKALGLRCRYEVGDVTYTGFAENLFQSYRYSGYKRETTATGTRTTYDYLDEDALARQAVTEWMNSPGHRRNLLNAESRRHAIGVAFGQDDSIYFTDVFC